MADDSIDPSTYPDPLSLLLMPKPKQQDDLGGANPALTRRPIGMPVSIGGANPPAALPAGLPGVPEYKNPPSPAPLPGSQPRNTNAAMGAAPAPPPVTDDISALHPMDPNNNALTGLYKQVQDAMQGRNAVPRPTYDQIKPRWYDRVAGIAAGTLAPPAIRGALASELTNRRYNSAMGKYNSQVAPYDVQLAELDKQIPIANDQARIANEAYSQAAERIRLRQADQKNQAYADQANARAEKYGAEFVAGSEMQDPNSPTGWTAMTADGQRKPFTPKTKAQKEPANYQQAYAAASAETDPKERARLTGLGDKLLRDEKNLRAIDHPDREKEATKGQFNAANTRKEQALGKAKTAYQKAIKDLNPADPKDSDAFNQAHEQFKQDAQQAQDDYENEITTLGGNAKHEDVSKWKGFGSSDNAGATGKAPESNQGSPTAAAPKPTSQSAAAPPAQKPQGQPMGYQGDKITFNGKQTSITAVRRNPQSGEHAYQIDGKWYTDSELKPTH